jgi:hypothetical protein
MIHHVSVGTNDLARARAFYDPVLTLLGYRLVSEDEVSIDYGIAHIVFSVETPVDGARVTPATACMLPSKLSTVRWSIASMRSRSPMAGPTMVRRGQAAVRRKLLQRLCPGSGREQDRSRHPLRALSALTGRTARQRQRFLPPAPGSAMAKQFRRP